MVDISNFPRKHELALAAHLGPVHCLKYTRDGKYFFSSSADRLIKLWNHATGQNIRAYEGHGKDVLSLALPKENGDAHKFASSSSDKSIMLWDIMSGRVVRRFTGHHQRVNGVDFNDDSSVVASASYDATVKMWDCKSQSRLPIQTFSEFGDSVECLIIAGHLIFAGSVDGVVRQYDLRKGHIVSDNVGFPITSLDLTIDGKCLLVGTTDSKIRLFDLDTGELLNSYTGHKNKIYKIQSRYILDETCVLSGSEDGMLYLWGLLDANLLLSISAHKKSVTSLSVNHSAKGVFLSSDADGNIKIWRSGDSQC